MLVAGIVTLVQLFSIGPVGGKLPIVMGTSSGFIGVCQSVAGVMGGGVAAYGAILGASLLGGLFETVLGFFLKASAPFLPICGYRYSRSLHRSFLNQRRHRFLRRRQQF